MAVQGLDMALMPKRPEQPRVPRYNRKAAESQSTLVAESVDEQPLKETDSAGNDGTSWLFRLLLTKRGADSE